MDIFITVLNVVKVSPGVTFTRLGNYIYFKDTVALVDQQSVLPLQSGSQPVIISPEFRFSITTLKHINLSSQIIYTKVLENSDNAIQIPDLFINAQLSYENIFFNGNLDMHAGVDVHFKSTYYPLGYDVPTQQFYVQARDNRQLLLKVPEFPLDRCIFQCQDQAWQNILQIS